MRGVVWWRIVRDVVSLALAVVLLVWGLPRIAGVGWSQILEPLQRLPVPALILLAGLQLCALLAFTFTITGSLPGISHSRALTVNLAGSLVANTLPFGGALGIGATYAICRSWGFGRSAIGISVVLGGIFAAAGKVLLPLVGLAALVLQGGHISPALRDAALVGVLTLVALLVIFIVVMASDRAAHAVGRFIQRVAEASLRLIRRPRRLGWEQGIARLREQTQDVMRRGWLQMSLGTLGYFVIYFVLFWLCMHICGLVIGVGTMLAAFALGRLLTSVAVTPGGLGLVEAGSVALLVAMGADPALAAAGTLLFTIFTHVIEIPFGIAAWLMWLWGRKKQDSITATASRTRPDTERSPG
ncbi:MAG TPA: lysylphosphatidylglycerol synthase transmembrane domain-containing protein [Candidatus Limnocylindria bacterium]|nr:lysylphosphatidylglycerol synthase transmembrane domain-containing protein [Candidatus Limnocylindria bacterium]